MQRVIPRLAALAALFALLPGPAMATTREIADLEPTRLSFDRSVLNQLTFGTYRDPFDELQTRPYNLIFSNIGRHSNTSPWQGQEGSYTRYFNALIGNNGAANVDNGADAIQGSYIQRQSDRLAWGISAALLAGTDGNDTTSGTSTFSNADDLTGADLRGAVSTQISERRVLGGGFRLTQAGADVTEDDFETGVGGFSSGNEFAQAHFSVDVGMRSFLNERSSWEIQGVLGYGNAEQDQQSDNLDGAGAVVDTFVIANYDITDISLGFHGGYNRLKLESLGETEFRAGLTHTQRELDNDDLSFSETGGTTTPLLTLLGQDAITSTNVFLSAKTIFQAGETEMFTGGQIGFGVVTGSTQIDAAGVIVNEEVDDSQVSLGVTAGLRQSILQGKLRFIVSGRADAVDWESGTFFDTASTTDTSTVTSASYSIGLEAVLANVVLDFAWLSGIEATVIPVPLGLPQGSRRTVQLDRLVFSAGISW